MDELNIIVKTNGTFVQTFELSAWADLYDFSAGHWHAMLRKNTQTAIANFEWSTENGNIVYAATPAHGEIAFTVNPQVGDTIMIGAAVVEFGATDGVMVATDVNGTMTALLEFLQSSENEYISRCTYSLAWGTDGPELSIVYKTAGTLGNSFPIDADVSGATLSGETLSGGGAMLTLTASIEELGAFAGDYVYDVRWQMEDESLMVPIVGGTITFEPGVTRDTVDEMS